MSSHVFLHQDRRAFHIGRRRWLLVAGLLVIGGVALIAVPILSSQTDRATQAGLDYARQTIVWTHGPTIARNRVVRLRDLAAVLPSITQPSLRHDVNASELVRQYGANRQVELLVLSGTYNSLPPDEGVDVQGEVLVVVDTQTDRVLLLTD